ncbi:DeoR/GlpR family DNA-binding transcription regulator [Helcobacillus massiliensis]|uniref:DeoR/GlpR family DNA-binding transcription regulator n=1 Tax=Helcobacillus massiliensis TaxID=521392 RepID=UPI0021A899AF|nr:DeoR/GlpR family DNA-binding transcription regulator [Helcobacillus massiliensis]MCT1558403.1 DeoR/GlpR family DNA-binding transcription regulator [Helcobacillus massiliensis]MCT2036825.1 DeoR/GlpR family DNA-binding transcription regulator [Helcobacillus massiliensis]MCT2332606.1 DeoR/GlpR family DNA-binding transcription regulator [Helcobacillus massiliensis]MDK7741543.1 DeoR/GlpR family DNA-binding transcription regulator [Helcobacillus massiliensis]WOO92337.1 DeoR/GlpR family DNA-bindin
MSSDRHVPPVGHDKSSRWDFVLGQLAQTKRLSVADVAAQLGISESTVRRDFVDMEKAQLARRVHGGLVAVDIAYNLAASPRGDGAGDQRERIAAAAAAMVQPGSIVGFNGGRTTTASARRIVARSDLDTGGSVPGLTVVCAALNIAMETVLRPAVRTVVLGGVAEPRSFELTGPLAQYTMRDLWLDIMFVGVIGVDVDAGITCDSDAEAGVTRTMISHSRRVVGLATGDKIGKRALAGICPLSALTDLIVTGEVPTQLREACAERHVRLHAV